MHSPLPKSAQTASDQRSRFTALLVTVMAVLLASACSFSLGGESPAEAAVDLIEGDFSDQFGLVLTNASCDDPPSEDIGTTFECRANLGEAVVLFDVEIDAEDHILARSTNVVYPEQQVAIGEAIADSFANQGVEGLSADALDCGGEIIVLGSEMSFVCALTEPGSGDVYDTSIRINDIENLTFDFVVADEPRS